VGEVKQLTRGYVTQTYDGQAAAAAAAARQSTPANQSRLIHCFMCSGVQTVQLHLSNINTNQNCDKIHA